MHGTAGALHVLMNIVGFDDLVMLPEVDIEAWNKVFEINVTLTLRGIQACAPLIKESGGGSIVNIGSVPASPARLRPATRPPNGPSRASRSAAYVYADWGIRCNVIQPGFIETDMTAAMSSNVLVKKMAHHTMSNSVLLRRSSKAEEIANTGTVPSQRRVVLHHGDRPCRRRRLVVVCPVSRRRKIAPHACPAEEKEELQEFIKHFH